MKKIVIPIVIIAILGLTAAAWFFTPLGDAVMGLFGEKIDPAEYVVKIDDGELEMPAPPCMVDGEFMISLTSVGEALGHRVVLDKDDAYIVMDSKVVQLNKDSNTVIINKEEEQIDVAPVIVEDDFYVSTGFISKTFEIEVSVNRAEKEIVVEREFEMLIPYKKALSIFKEGTTAKVTDVETGISYMVRRTEGGYDTLADVEPLALEDTQKMHETYGDNLHTAKRAIIVTIDDMDIAASICAFPHSGREDAPYGAVVDNRSGGTGSGINLDSIRDNGIEGVVDIYFYNSLMPGLNRTDEMHQAKVLEAANNQKED